MAVGGRRASRLGLPHPLDVFELIFEKFVGSVCNPRRGIGVCRTAVRRVVLEATVSRRVVRRRHDDAISLCAATSTVVIDDRQTDRWRWCETIGAVDHHVHTVGSEHLECGDPRGLAETMGVLAQEQRA